MSDRASGDPPTKILVRLADPTTDGAGASEVYRPAVETSPASFELDPPDADEMAGRMRRILERAPWLVAVDDGRVIGYAYSSAHRERAAYRWSVDVSAYVHPEWQGRGVGRSLYTPLFEAIRTQGFVNVFAGVTLPNDASVRLHRSFGLEEIGVFREVGYKFGAWHDVTWYGTRLQDPSDPPAEPILLPEFLATAEGQVWLKSMAHPTRVDFGDKL